MDTHPRDIEIVDSREQQSVAIRTVGPMSELDIGAIFSESATRLVTYVEQRDMVPSGAPYARYHEFGPDRVDIEVGFPVDGDLDDVRELQADAVIGASELPGGRVARLLHSGSYQELGSAYQKLERFLNDSGSQAAGAPWESYLVMPDAASGDASLLQTEVCWPIS
jgi:effector-binding domain-containing protein